jgi:hypothetical protein
MEPLEDALDLALMLRPHELYEEGWDAIVVANIGEAADPGGLRRLISERVRAAKAARTQPASESGSNVPASK